MRKCIVYIGDFDIRNENVQSHLVRNNSKIFNVLNYHVAFIGINRNIRSFCNSVCIQTTHLDDGNDLYELPDTLNVSGLLKINQISNSIISILELLSNVYDIQYVITYQSPTYAIVLKKIAKWCIDKNIFYIVNCADIPIFDQQSYVRKIVMKLNWKLMHRINDQNANGIIAVSDYIADFYGKPNREVVVIPPLFDLFNENDPIIRNDTTVFIYAGTPFKTKGKKINPCGMKDRLDYVIDLFLSLSQQGEDYLLIIVGISKEDYIIGVPRHAKKLSKENKIKFLGRKSHVDTLKLISQSDFSVNYRDENVMTLAGYSTKIVESVSLGTPVVINDIGDTFRYLESNVCGIKISRDKKESVKILSALCKMSVEERYKIKQQCKNSEVFNWRKFINVVKNFLTNIQQD